MPMMIANMFQHNVDGFKQNNDFMLNSYEKPLVDLVVRVGLGMSMFTVQAHIYM